MKKAAETQKSLLDPLKQIHFDCATHFIRKMVVLEMIYQETKTMKQQPTYKQNPDQLMNMRNYQQTKTDKEQTKYHQRVKNNKATSTAQQEQ